MPTFYFNFVYSHIIIFPTLAIYIKTKMNSKENRHFYDCGDLSDPDTKYALLDDESIDSTDNVATPSTSTTTSEITEDITINNTDESTVDGSLSPHIHIMKEY